MSDSYGGNVDNPDQQPAYPADGTVVTTNGAAPTPTTLSLMATALPQPAMLRSTKDAFQHSYRLQAKDALRSLWAGPVPFLIWFA